MVLPFNHLILCQPLLLLPSVFPRTRVFSSESALPIRWPKYWCFSFSNSTSSEYSGLISFGIDWFDLLVVQGILRCFFHHHSSKVSILQHSAFSIAQYSYLYMTTRPMLLIARCNSLIKMLKKHVFFKNSRMWETDKRTGSLLGRGSGKPEHLTRDNPVPPTSVPC